MYAQTLWELKKDKDGIKVYTGSVGNAHTKAVRVLCTVNASLSQLTAFLLDAKAHIQWVYNTTVSYPVKQVAPGHIIYYSEVGLAWPFTNRDVVIDMNIWQPAGSKTMYITANSIAGIVPAKEGIIRVTTSKSSWTVTPTGNNQLSIDYTAQADPGGSIPDWIINSFCAKGPYETFRKLKEKVNATAYKNAHFSFIKD